MPTHYKHHHHHHHPLLTDVGDHVAPRISDLGVQDPNNNVPFHHLRSLIQAELEKKKKKTLTMAVMSSQVILGFSERFKKVKAICVNSSTFECDLSKQYSGGGG